MVQDLHEDMGPWVPGLLNPEPVSAETRMGTPTGSPRTPSLFPGRVWLAFPLVGHYYAEIMPLYSQYTPKG